MIIENYLVYWCFWLW